MKKHHLHFTPTRTVPTTRSHPPRIPSARVISLQLSLKRENATERNRRIQNKPIYIIFVLFSLVWCPKSESKTSSSSSSVLCFYVKSYSSLSLMAQNLTSRGRAVCSVLVLVVLVLLFLTTNLVPVTEAIWLTIPTSGTKCVSEEIQNHVVVLADYYVVVDEAPQQYRTPTISVKVTSPYGNNLHHVENVTHGQFAFTTTESGSYLACFWLDGEHQEGVGATLNLDWRSGIAARDWDSVAKQQKVKGVELELIKLEGAVQAIHDNLNYLKDREAEMRQVSESTNSKVAWLSIMSLGVCIVVSALQLWHLKTYFRKKKLI